MSAMPQGRYPIQAVPPVSAFVAVLSVWQSLLKLGLMVWSVFAGNWAKTCVPDGVCEQLVGPDPAKGVCETRTVRCC